MNFLHKQLDLALDAAVEVTLDHAANVQLLDDANFEQYRRGQPYRYYGGHADVSPVRVPAPTAGRWHLVIDLGGGVGRVRASCRVLEPQPV